MSFWPVPVPRVEAPGTTLAEEPTIALTRIASMLGLGADAAPAAVADAVYVALHGRAPTVKVAPAEDIG